MLIKNQIIKKLEEFDRQSLTRTQKISPTLNKDIVDFTSNDYLGISQDPQIKKAYIEGVEKYGFGSCSSALVSGYSDSQKELEEEFARFTNRERAIFVNSGYLANISAITALAGRDNIVFSDKQSHGSILDAIHLSRAKHVRYRHHDLEHLTELAKSSPPDIIITETVFSMEGNITPFKKIAKLAAENNSLLIADDAHGIGVLGDDGGGACQLFGLTQQEVPCLITPLSKGFGGFGAMISGESWIIEAIIQFAKNYRCTTSLPQSICYGLLKSLELVRVDKFRRNKLHELSQFFTEESTRLGLPLISKDITAIKAISLNGNDDAITLSRFMENNGFLVSCIRPPTVPNGTAILRVTLRYMHSKENIRSLLEYVSKYKEIL